MNEKKAMNTALLATPSAPRPLTPPSGPSPPSFPGTPPSFQGAPCPPAGGNNNNRRRRGKGRQGGPGGVQQQLPPLAPLPWHPWQGTVQVWPQGRPSAPAPVFGMQPSPLTFQQTRTTPHAFAAFPGGHEHQGGYGHMPYAYGLPPPGFTTSSSIQRLHHPLPLPSSALGTHRHWQTLSTLCP